MLTAAGQQSLSSRILLVEDHEDTALVLARLLEGSGCRVKVAGNAEIALGLAAEESFDVVLCDIGLPEISGHELMRRMHQQYGLKGIALTGYASEQDVKIGESSGFEDYLVKPIDVAQLVCAIQRVMRA